MKKPVIFVLFTLVSTFTHAIEPCTQVWHQGSLAWSYAGTDIYHVYMQPTEGNNVLDCVNPSKPSFICETLRCDTNGLSDFTCKDEDLPISHCVNFLIEQCQDEDPLTAPTVIQLEFAIRSGVPATGPCNGAEDPPPSL